MSEVQTVLRNALVSILAAALVLGAGVSAVTGTPTPEQIVHFV